MGEYVIYAEHVIYAGRRHLCAASARSTARDEASRADHIEV
jgi:hypothetical protein